MGVPAFFRWLSRKYVSIIVDAVEERKREVNGEKIPVDATQPNQNYQEFDNLYLDMNGIIHPCTHPEDRPAPKTEEEMFILIFEYIDRLFSIVRPRKLLYMAIDGVAPRAKMNQQRSRRFRAAKEAIDKREQIANIRRKLENEGIPLPPPRKEEEHFDSNCITPGTPFMARLSTALRYYIHKRITTDLAWQKIQVILSDANVPGEGEHKIMDYIRRQRASPEHDPNTVHCLCGADADLIMLGLATHEANFNIIREEFVPNQPRPCELCGQYGHDLEHCQGLARTEAGPDQADPLKKEKNFIFIRLPVLREYLERELAMPNLPFPFCIERAIDDWVMMCFFVGNDFLPHLPSLEIRENAIDRLVKLYKQMVYQTGGWLTENGEMNIPRVKMMMAELGKVEDEIFKQRQVLLFDFPHPIKEVQLRELRFKESKRMARQRQRRNKRHQKAANLMPYNASLIAPTAIGEQKQLSGEETRRMAADDREQMYQAASQKLMSLLTPVERKRKAEDDPAASPNGAPAAKSFKDGHGAAQASGQPPKSAAITFTTPSGKAAPLAKGAVGALGTEDDSEEDEEEEEPTDSIRLWEAGWKGRYYQAKFQVSEGNLEFRKKVACAYMEGLSWVLRYYYQGCASWTWYFPFHYAPFASDFDLIGDFEPDFSHPTRPFKPMEQLMGVFPAASRAHIPESWRSLMTDPNSPIIDFYPQDFEIDLNGKKFAWQGVALLPFVDEKRLLTALDMVYDELTEDEIARNSKGPDRLFIGNKHELFSLAYEVHGLGKAKQRNGNGKVVENEEKRDDKADREESGNEEGKNADQTKNDEVSKGAEVEASVEVEGKQWFYIDAKKAFGMSGEITHDQNAFEVGVSHRTLFRNSLEFDDIKNNTCIMVQYRDPQFPRHFVYKSTRLEGIKELPRVLKPQDYDERRQGPFRPQIGFTRDMPRANLSASGHRTLNHYVGEHNRRSGPAALFPVYQQAPQPQNPLPWHSNAPPPMASFAQMAMPPPPPMPPAEWMMRQQQRRPPQPHPSSIPWGQPPPFVQQQQQHGQYNHQNNYNNDNTWRNNQYQQQQNPRYEDRQRDGRRQSYPRQQEQQHSRPAPHRDQYSAPRPNYQQQRRQ